MLSSAASVATAAGIIVAYGFCLGIGFYLSRKTTNQIDWLFLSSAERDSLKGMVA